MTLIAVAILLNVLFQIFSTKSLFNVQYVLKKIYYLLGGIHQLRGQEEPNHTAHRKVDFNEFVQNSLCCDMGIIIFDLHGYEGC